MDLIELQTNYVDLQTRHSIELDQIHKEYKHIIQQQKETFLKLFEHYSQEHSINVDKQLKDLQAKQDKVFNEKLELKLAELQEKLITLNQSDSEDMELRIRRVVTSILRDEKLVEQAKVKQQLDQIEKDLKAETEKHVQNYFKSQSEFFKEQIKSGVQQEHLIHKDLINKKLESLFKSSEEKRRNANMLFARHLSGLTFFIENAHKQLGILNQAHSDLLKNKEITDYFGPQSEATPGGAVNAINSTSSTQASSSNSNDFLFLFGSTTKKNTSAKDIRSEGEDQPFVVDEDLLNDLA